MFAIDFFDFYIKCFPPPHTIPMNASRCGGHTNEEKSVYKKR